MEYAMLKYYHKNWFLQLLAIVYVNQLVFNVNKVSANGDQFVSNQKSACYVYEYDSHEKKKCQFPFSIKDKLTGDTKTFHGCTTFRDHRRRSWCSLNVTEDGFHTWGSRKWGYCSQERACVKDYSVEEEKIKDFLAYTFDRESTVRSNLEWLKDLDTHPLVDSTCPCIHYKTCEWSSELTRLVNPLPKSNPQRRRAVKFMKSVICDKRKRKLRCCAERETIDPPDLSPLPPIGNDTELGTWLPLAGKGQCGKSTGAALIHQGDDATPGEFPFAALLGYESPKDPGKLFYTCGGTVINKRYILTAAHCTKTDLGPIKEVVLGEHKVGDDPDCWKNNNLEEYCQPPVQRFGVEEVVSHPNWNAAGNGYRKGYDIALVRLDRKATLYLDDSQSPVLPVCLSIGDYEPGGSQNPINETNRVTVMGWGKTTNDRAEVDTNYQMWGVSQDILQKIEIPIVSGKTCREEYSQRWKDTLLCAGAEEGKDSCGGDSGGPMTFRHSVNDPWYLVGLVSYGATKCGDKPGVYTYVPHYIGWIRRTLRE